MNVILENPLENYFRGKEYIRIINVCLVSEDENNLRANIKRLFEDDTVKNTFYYGFGHNHLWVCEKEKKDKRIIFVTF